MTVQDHAEPSANDTGTVSKIDAWLTPSDSRDVLRDLLVKRNKVGAESLIGRHLSNLIEQVRNHDRETDPIARANLERFMGWSVAAIQKAA